MRYTKPGDLLQTRIPKTLLWKSPERMLLKGAWDFQPGTHPFLEGGTVVLVIEKHASLHSIKVVTPLGVAWVSDFPERFTFLLEET